VKLEKIERPGSLGDGEEGWGASQDSGHIVDYQSGKIKKVGRRVWKFFIFLL